MTTPTVDARPVPATGEPSKCPVDFERRLVCLLGLPFDAVDVHQAVRRIRQDAFDNCRCFVSTPNLNFAMTARADAAFRRTVLRCDLSLADGMPIVWISKLLGLPVRQRVSGADVFEALQVHAGPPIGVYLFGGPPGAAERASERINRRGGGMQCVGFDVGGFGPIESMSTEEQIARINRSGAHFVVVSLGAVKGQGWIERNAARLTAPVLAHLGAVVNFAAGDLRRAPRWMQAHGLEWLWRIREEPSLWRRYWRDGVDTVRLLATHVLPDAIEARRWRVRDEGSAAPPLLSRSEVPGGSALRLTGDWRAESGLPALRSALAECVNDKRRLTIELDQVTGIGDAAVALLLVARGWFDMHAGLEVRGATGPVLTTLQRKMAAATILGDGR